MSLFVIYSRINPTYLQLTKNEMDTVENIKHIEKTTPSGGTVLVLNTAAVIGPEAEAMLQALHSRSIGGIRSHLKVLAKKGPADFLSTYYVGYGHKSIGDCGTCTLFIEGVSMLAAKAIQQWPLYSGQEASTRYIDFAHQKFVDPISTEESKNVLETWRSFYLKGLEVLQEDLKKRFVRGEKEDEKIYIKAIKARAFDIMRGFLPAGASTNLAWHTNFRQAADHLMMLRNHPLLEVREIAEAAEQALKEAFPGSFGHKVYETTEKFNKEWMEKNCYYTDENAKDFELARNDIDRESLKTFSETIKNRPAKTEMPKEIGETGTMQFKFLLDFGSFRDIQRHRAVLQKMPLVTQKHGFANWYLEELPEGLRSEAITLLKSQEEKIKALKSTKEISQYYVAMGYNLPNKVTGNLPSLVYLVELRATRFVHPTLRRRAIQMAETLKKEFEKEGLAIHLDADPDRFDIKRGEHDILEKTT